MANIVLKDSSGTPTTYNNVESLRVPTTESGVTAVFSEGTGAPVWGQITGTLSNQTDLNDALNSKGTYSKPASGIPSTDMTSEVQTSLSKADSALQEHQDISGKEDSSNRVTSISSSSTDAQYPSAKCVYDLVGTIEATLQTIRGV